MNNKTRNSLILFFPLLTIFIFGNIFLGNIKKELSTVQQTHSKLNKKLQAGKTVEKEKEDAMLHLEELKKAKLKEQKVLRKIDNSTITFDYLVRLSQNFAQNIRFDFSRSKNVSNANTNYNEYMITGNAGLTNLQKMILNLEQQKAIYTIEDLAIANRNSVNTDSVEFSLKINAYYDKSGSDYDKINLTRLPYSFYKFNYFKPVIEIEELESVDPSLVNVKKSKLIGMTHNKAFIKESNGLINILSMNDPVAYGKLSFIDPENQEVIFELKINNKEEIYKMSLKGEES
ncbi:MAG: hypothetical protein SVM86_05275 [Candidatus Cloacimonadota bacterium]|nr:hypothetical protein [Candidatus Cloacimonadota bacterium]